MIFNQEFLQETQEWRYMSGGSKCATEVADDVWGSFSAVTSVWLTNHQLGTRDPGVKLPAVL